MVFCTKCGAENPEGSRYCHKCGEKISNMSDTRTNLSDNRTAYAQKEVVKEKKSDDTLLNIVLIIAIVIIVIIIVQMIFAYSFIAPIFNNFFG
ncbi:MAG: hypothetical protein A4E25_00496 [Methanobacterium sp. PtaB.Bin024]|nr:MAG: hypothetical protein A4E25_00496 [Methanobacterium sp. PtaB.Bin024]